jgi:hypothetical protein
MASTTHSAAARTALTMNDVQPSAVKAFTVTQGKIAEVDILGDLIRLRKLDLSALEGVMRASSALWTLAKNRPFGAASYALFRDRYRHKVI